MPLLSLKGLDSLEIDDSAGSAVEVKSWVTRIEYQDNPEEDDITAVDADASRFIAPDPLRFDRLNIDIQMRDETAGPLSIVYPRTGIRTVKILYNKPSGLSPDNSENHQWAGEFVLASVNFTFEGRGRTMQLGFVAGDGDGLVYSNPA